MGKNFFVKGVLSFCVGAFIFISASTNTKAQEINDLSEITESNQEEIEVSDVEAELTDGDTIFIEDDTYEGQSDGTSYSEGYVSSENSSVMNGVDYSSVFDALYYWNLYPDLQKFIDKPNSYTDENAMMLLEHFVEHGMSEGRIGNSEFNVEFYKNRYSDLREGYRNNLKEYYIHYLNHGKNEGRDAKSKCTELINPITKHEGVDYSAVYDYYYYLEKYPDLKAVYYGDDITLLEHFVLHGMNEQRQGNAFFDEIAYRCLYQDLRAAFRQDYKDYYLHYINHGKSEGRIAVGSHTVQNPVHTYDGIDISKIYDYDYYSSRYSSILGNLASDDIAVLDYFVNNGIRAGHIGKQNYDAQFYETFKLAFDNAKTAITSYLGFDFSSVYNYLYYVLNYSDLVKAFGVDPTKIFLHFIDNGIFENRQARKDVIANTASYNAIRDAYSPYRFIHEKLSGAVFIGDSRVIDLCRYNDVNPLIPYAQNNMGYQYMVDAVNNSGDRLKIIMMGTNDAANIDAYLNFYRNRNDVILLTLGPVNDSYLINPGFALSGYPLRDYHMSSFNERLMSLGKPLIDLYSFMVNSGFGTGDGVHYDIPTNNRMWQFIKSQLLL